MSNYAPPQFDTQFGGYGGPIGVENGTNRNVDLHIPIRLICTLYIDLSCTVWPQCIKQQTTAIGIGGLCYMPYRKSSLTVQNSETNVQYIGLMCPTITISPPKL